MGLFGFGKAKREPEMMLIDMIEHNVNHIIETEGKDRSEATYLAICLIFDDLMARENGQKAYQGMMGLLQTRYIEQMNDVITYIAWSTGKIALKPEFEAELIRRHQT